MHSNSGLNKNTFIHWILFCICVAGFILRIYNIDKHDFWYDEVLTYDAVTYCSPILAMLDKHPSMYFFTIKIWCNLFGKSDIMLRLFSVFFGVISIIIVFKIGTLFFDKLSALLAACFMSFSPFHIWYAQEARMFIFSTFLCVLSLYFLLRALYDNKNRYWLGHLFSITAFILTTYFAFLFLITEGMLILLHRHRRFLLKWFINVSIALFLFTIFGLSNFIRQYTSLSYNFWLPKPYSAGILLKTLDKFMLGYNGCPLTYYIISALVVITITTALFKVPRTNKLMFLAFFMFPILLIYFFSFLFVPVYIDRHLIIFSPFLYILLSKSITSIKRPITKKLVLVSFVTVMAISIFNHHNDVVSFEHMAPGVHLKKSVKPIADFFLREKRADDAVGFSNIGFNYTFGHQILKVSKDFFSLHSFYFYIPNADPYFEKLVLRYNSFKYRDKWTLVDLTEDDIMQYGIKRLWLFSTSWERRGMLDTNDLAVKKWFEENFTKDRQWYIDGVWISLFVFDKPSGKYERKEPNGVIS